jgi:hypothetical protein
VNKLKISLRVGYELFFFVVAWVGAFQAMILKRDLMIMYEAATTGVSTAQIIDRQNASSGMYAFSEGLEVLFLVSFFYLLWPLCLIWPDGCSDRGPPLRLSEGLPPYLHPSRDPAVTLTGRKLHSLPTRTCGLFHGFAVGGIFDTGVGVGLPLTTVTTEFGIDDTEPFRLTCGTLTNHVRVVRRRTLGDASELAAQAR